MGNPLEGRDLTVEMETAVWAAAFTSGLRGRGDAHAVRAAVVAADAAVAALADAINAANGSPSLPTGPPGARTVA